MNPIYAFLIMLSLVTVTTTIWYFTEPLGALTINISSDIVNNSASLDAGTQANVGRTFDLLGFCLRFWGPLVDVVYVAWFLIYGTRVRPDSEVYY